MYKICVFAGTSEGRRITEFLLKQETAVFACTATGYGGVLLPESEKLRVSSKRLSEDEMLELFNKELFDLVIDATHPYADAATKSISNAAEKAGIKYIRIAREKSEYGQEITYAENAEEALQLLEEKEGNILLTTGSKEISGFAKIKGFKERVYARVLPVAESIAACSDAGLIPSHIIAMQGPFDEPMNYETLKYCDAKWLVTKDGGQAGGFTEKLAAAKRFGAGVIVIGRPAGNEEGISYTDCLKLLEDDFGFINVPKITIVGTGPGSSDCLTLEAADAIRKADCLIGAGRMLSQAGYGKICVEAIWPEDIISAVENNHMCSRIAVLMSGDTGFFSGTKRLLPQLSGYSVKVIPGISSLSYLMAKLKKPYSDVYLMSLHGREGSIAEAVKAHEKVFCLVGGENGARDLIDELISAGFADSVVSVGENLSLENENVTTAKALELQGCSFSRLSAVYIER